LPAAQVELIEYPRATGAGYGGEPRLVVPDADAKDKTAQAALPGRSVTNSAICSFYSYARPAGRYRVAWRVKVADNTVTDQVLRISVGGGGRGYKDGSLGLRGTDFSQSNQYQEFACTAEKDEGGFFGVSAVWLGKGAVYVDWVKVVSEELFSERQVLERRGPVDVPDAWALPAGAPWRVHVAKGLWWDFFGVSEALAVIRAGTVTSSYHGHGQFGHSLRGFPATAAELMAYHLVVLANVDAQALGAQGRLLLEEYVRNGGGLVILGGPFAFESGGYRHTALERMLPCELQAEKRKKAEKPLVLKAGPDAGAMLPADLAWQQNPRVVYYHPATAKSGAQVVATMDGVPALIAGEFGKGRIAVFLATAEGETPPDQLPFWEWSDQPRLLAAVCRWTASAPRAAPVAESRKADRELLSGLAVPGEARDQEQRLARIQGVLPRCRDALLARDILAAVAMLDLALPADVVEDVASAVRPWLTPEFRRDAQSLVAGEDLSKAALGLRLLGALGIAEDADRMRRVLEQGSAALATKAGEEASETDLFKPKTSAPDPAGEDKVRLAAVAAVGDLRAGAALEALRRVTEQYSQKRQQLLDPTETSEVSERIYQESLAVRCRLGDESAVMPFVEVLQRIATDIEQFRNYQDVMLVNPDDQTLMRARKVAGVRLPLLARRLADCRSTLEHVPPAITATLAPALAARADPALTPFFFAALAARPERKIGKEQTAALLPLLRECSEPGARRLILQIALEANDPALTRQAQTAVQELAAAPDSATVRFALRQLPILPAPARAAVSVAARKHPDAEVRRLAELLQCP
jgi:uncharacterized membrane protein